MWHPWICQSVLFPLDSSQHSIGLNLPWGLPRNQMEPHQRLRKPQIPSRRSQETMASASVPWTNLTPHQTGPILLSVTWLQEENWTSATAWSSWAIHLPRSAKPSITVTWSQTYPAWPQDTKTNQMFEFVWLGYCTHSETPQLWTSAYNNN